MTSIRAQTSIATVLLALVVAACGSARNASLPTPTIDVATSNLGKVLVDDSGRTLYMFERDTGEKSTCYGPCAIRWLPLRADGTPAAGHGADASAIGTIKRPDGQTEVTYNGHPLYLYAGDQAPGDTNGQGVHAFGAGWFAVTPAGNQVLRS
jgi:predicted lipoprotein with Yx(FWY)xxD motif